MLHPPLSMTGYRRITGDLQAGSSADEKKRHKEAPRGFLRHRQKYWAICGRNWMAQRLLPGPGRQALMSGRPSGWHENQLPVEKAYRSKALMNRRERRAAAKGSNNARNMPAETTPSALYQTGLEHLLSGRLLDAQICCQNALALDPVHADALHLTGLLCLQARQYDHAVEWISRAIRQQPKTDYLTNLGTALLSQGRPEEAVAAFDKAVQLKPDDADLWRNLGNVLADVHRLAEAILSYQQALKLNPHHCDAAHRVGLLLHRLNRSEEALVYFNMHGKIPSDSAPKLQMRALALYIQNKFEEGLRDIERAHALDPTNAEICNQAGAFLRQLGRDEQALRWFDRALLLWPNYPGALSNKAFALTHLHRFEEALAIYEAMRAADPSDAKVDFDAALVHLLTGNFAAGWARHDARLKVPGLQIARFEFSQPRWLGNEPIEGKTVLIQTDEGLGDSIQFARYVPMVAGMGARVILVVDDSLVPLLSGLSGVSECLSLSAGPPPAFDYYCPMCSLPLAFGTRLETIPSPRSYLPAPPAPRLQTWEERLGPRDRLRVGLVWSGNPKHKNDSNRSIRLRTLAPVLDADATFVSLQKDPRPDDKTYLDEANILDLSCHLTDFVETAALISCLDLVITVDTSVAHLAGGLGQPTWILLPYTPDWRWLLGRADSPWYPTAQLFRQDETRDYGPVVARLRNELDTMMSAGKSY
jgi:tetratricopeptide (TPR) repeat protein